MRTSWFDAVSSLFLTLTLMLSALVGVLFLLWCLLPDEVQRQSEPVAKVRMVRATSGIRIDQPFDTPSQEEVDALKPLDLQTALDSVVAVARLPGLTESLDPNSLDPKVGASGLEGRAPVGSAGPDLLSGETEASVPRHERWQIDWQAKDLGEYARQLGHFEIELGVIGGDQHGMDLAKGFASSVRARRLSDPSQEGRLYFMWTHASPLKEFEHRLLNQAGISTNGRFVLKFIPPALEAELAKLELEFARDAGHDSVEEIEKTVFVSIATANGFEFRVVAQRYQQD
ncbi:hypothetical protein [Rhodopirellula halodulae]|uniref:hypothetical protein n=1 Tax=Rhodopirellula halodulae TaxID=2894198 RepID=UPI001E2890EF|nr:hypothetical protein [Rhodopirellula sp. JC737]